MKNHLRVEIRLSGNLNKDTLKFANKFGYSNLQELLKEALREKIYGKNIKEQITNDFLKQLEEEKEYIFEEKKDLHEKLKKIANRF